MQERWWEREQEREIQKREPETENKWGWWSSWSVDHALGVRMRDRLSAWVETGYCISRRSSKLLHDNYRISGISRQEASLHSSSLTLYQDTQRRRKKSPPHRPPFCRSESEEWTVFGHSCSSAVSWCVLSGKWKSTWKVNWMGKYIRAGGDFFNYRHMSWDKLFIHE